MSGDYIACFYLSIYTSHKCVSFIPNFFQDQNCYNSNMHHQMAKARPAEEARGKYPAKNQGLILKRALYVDL